MTYIAREIEATSPATYDKDTYTIGIDSATLESGLLDGLSGVLRAVSGEFVGSSASTDLSDTANLLRVSTVFSGDVSGTYDATVVADNSHNHTSLTITLASTDLTDTASLIYDADFAGTGIMVRTAANTYTARSISGTTDKIDVSNGSAVSGNPIITISPTYTGQTSIITLGTIVTGVWQGTAIADAYISSAATWNAKQDALTFGIADTNSVVIDSIDVADNDYAKFTASGLEGRSYTEVKTDLSLDNVENTALSTWAGSSNITTVGTLSSGSIPFSLVTGTVPVNQGGTGQTTYTDGELLIGNSTGNTLAKATLTESTGINITNGSGTITIAADLGDFDTDDLSEGATNLYYTQARFDTAFAAKSTSDLSEGTNLYFTDERVDDRVAALIQNGTGLSWTYDDISNTLTGNVSLSAFDTGDLSEGSNLYYTDERVDDRVAALIQDGGGIVWTYSDAGGTLTPAVDHGSIAGLTDDDHTQYALLAGRSGGQTIIGGTGAGDDLTLSTTSNVTKGTYFLSELTSNGFVKTTGSNGALTIDTSSYLTGNETITLSGDVTGSGTTSIVCTVVDDSHNHTASTITLASTDLSDTSDLIRVSANSGLTAGGFVVADKITGAIGSTFETTISGNGVLFVVSSQIFNDSSNFVYDNSADKLVIGGATPADRLHLIGTASDITDGPFARFSFSTIDHAMHILPYAHDNISIIFDATYNGTNYTSYDAGSNYAIAKNSDTLSFRYNSGTASTATFSFSEAMYINTSGQLVCNNSVGIGGAPAGGVNLTVRDSDSATLIQSLNTSSTGYAGVNTNNNGSASANIISYGSSASGTIMSTSIANICAYISEPQASGMLVGTLTNYPIIFGTNNTAYMYLTASGALGLGTSTVPHGGVGAAKFAIDGTVSSFTAGPHVQYSVSTDDYPVFQQLNWSHDNIQIQFDAYHDSAGATRSSDAGSNYGIFKLSDVFSIGYDSGIAAGSLLSWNVYGIALNTSGNVGIGTGTPVNRLDVEGACVIGASYSGTNTAPTNGLLVEGNVAIGATSAPIELYVDGKAYISNDLFAAPAVGTYGGDGTKIVMWAGGPSTLAYSMGIASLEMWRAVPTSAAHAWYVHTSKIATLNATGFCVGGTPGVEIQATKSSGTTIVLSENTSVSGRSILQAKAESGTTDVYASIRVHGSSYSETLLSTSMTDAVCFLGQPQANGMAIGTYTNYPLILGTNNTARVYIPSGGGLGIETSTVPHGGVGHAKFAIHGTDASPSGAGPHVQYTVSSDPYPVFQQLNYTHDNVSLVFDAYWQSGVWRSSSSTGNYAIVKSGGNLKFYYDSGIAAGSSVSWNTQGIVLNTSGNVGIGSSPVNRLDVEGACAIGASYSGTSSAPANSLIVQERVGINTTTVPKGGVAYARFSINGTASNFADGPHITYNVSTDNYPVFHQLNYSHDNIQVMFDSYHDGSSRSSDAGSNYAIFKVSDQFRIAYDSGVAAGSVLAWNQDGIVLNTSGNVGIGTTSQTERLDVNGNARIRSIGSGTYSAPVNQTSTGVLTTSTSDIAFKENVVSIEDALSKVTKMRGVFYNWKDDESKTKRIGVIAQEVEKVCPELVFRNPVDGYRGMYYAETSALLVEAVKELNAKVISLEEELLKYKKAA